MRKSILAAIQIFKTDPAVLSDGEKTTVSIQSTSSFFLGSPGMGSNWAVKVRYGLGSGNH